MKISSLRALEILDSRGKPTVGAVLTLDDGSVHSASVPSGASTGSHEAVELRDGDEKRFDGAGVLKAVENINTHIAVSLKDFDVEDVNAIDARIIEIDGTESKSKLGANATLAVSMACARGTAHSHKIPLWKFINKYYFSNQQLTTYNLQPSFPRLMVNLINGGKHANWGFDIQEFMIMTKDTLPSKSTRVAAEIFASLAKVLKKQGQNVLVGDEGGYSPAFTSNFAPYDAILEAAEQIGYKNTVDFEFAMDAASSEFYENGKYHLKREGKLVNSDELIAFYSEMGQKYHVQSFEDPFFEDDWESFEKFTALATQFGFQVVGDDFTVTNPKRIQEAVEKKAANAIIIKPNQIGTIFETVKAIQTARAGGWKIIVSHRSGETEDTFIADLAYGSGADFIKTGSMSRSERLAKYNRLLEIENQLER